MSNKSVENFKFSRKCYFPVSTRNTGSETATRHQLPMALNGKYAKKFISIKIFVQ